jgi:hypothetical protein
MADFEIEFRLEEKNQLASVQQSGNIYTVLPQDKHLKEQYGETVLLEANGDFAWRNLGPEHYKFVLSIAVALKKHLGFPE